MELKIKNENRGRKCFFVNGEEVCVDGNSQGHFTGATAAERDKIASKAGIKVWADGEPCFVDSPAKSRPWLVIARDNRGSDMRVIPIEESDWYIGTAMASERPDTAAGYSFVKIGGEAVEPVSVPAAAPSEPAKFDATAFTARNGNTVIADIADLDADALAKVEEAEKARDKPRSGVLKAIDERLEELAG